MTWLINGRGIAGKVKNTTQLSDQQIKEWGAEAKRECPNCKHIIDNSDVSLEWPGLPSGVKFDPSDLELLEHLAGKVGLENLKPHMLIDEFIPTLEADQGICYTHPENLPGVRKDGSGAHLFHRSLNAYATGRRKRRKINSDSSMSEDRVRWHKTGKTKPVFENGVHKGWKKIMVLYRDSKRGCKPDKANWVMHQYHLGIEEDEKDGELVVSKIFYQQQSKKIDKNDDNPAYEEFDASTLRSSPRTPKTNTPQPPRPGISSPDDDAHEHDPCFLSHKNPEIETEVPSSPVSDVHWNDEDAHHAWLAGQSQAVEDPDPYNVNESLLCHEPFPFIQEPTLQFPYIGLDQGRNEQIDRNMSAVFGFSDLNDMKMDIQPDLSLAVQSTTPFSSANLFSLQPFAKSLIRFIVSALQDLQFSSQESISSWLDRL